MAPKFVNNEEILRNDVYVLHRIVSDVESEGLPVFVIPPHAGRHGSIAQRMADTCAATGRPTYTVELLPAKQRTKTTGVQNLVGMIYDCQTIINEAHGTDKIDLVCLCQGAWLGAIYTAKHQDRVNRYANFAGPINTKTGQDNIIEKYCSTINMAYHRALIAMNGGIQPGMMQWLSFAMVNPVQVYWERWANLGYAMLRNDEKEIAKHNRNNAWYDYTIDLAGNWFLDCLKNHFRDNRLFNGTWVVGDGAVNLANITCEVFLYAGEDDEITHPQQVSDMANKVSGKCHFTLFSKAGHTKVFVGTAELQQFVKDFF